jgi:CRISPR/Cas system-associated exonuclease Cas4 (RecB family)
MEFAGILDEVLNTLREAYRVKRRDVSISLISRCLRATWFRIQTGREVITNAMLYGSERHHWMERHFPEMVAQYGFECIPEVRVEYEGISGYIDLLCEKGGTRYAVELKFTSAPNGQNQFLPWYRRQLKYYIAIINAVGILILVDFNVEHYYKEVIVLTDDERKQVLKELKERHEVLKSGREPPPELGPWCKFCHYRLQCFTKRLA